jgi:hypothetical protein
LKRIIILIVAATLTTGILPAQAIGLGGGLEFGCTDLYAETQFPYFAAIAALYVWPVFLQFSLGEYLDSHDLPKWMMQFWQIRANAGYEFTIVSGYRLGLSAEVKLDYYVNPELSEEFDSYTSGWQNSESVELLGRKDTRFGNVFIRAGLPMTMYYDEYTGQKFVVDGYIDFGAEDDFNGFGGYVSPHVHLSNGEYSSRWTGFEAAAYRTFEMEKSAVSFEARLTAAVPASDFASRGFTLTPRFQMNITPGLSWWAKLECGHIAGDLATTILPSLGVNFLTGDY